MSQFGIYFCLTYIYLITHSMVQSHSWEANWFAASQEIPRISRNPKVHYRTHKRPPPVSILGLPKPVHMPISHLLEIHPNIIHPSTPRSPQWSASHMFKHTNSDAKTHCLLLSIIRDLGNIRVCSQDHFRCLICRLRNVYMSFILKTGRPKEK